MKSKPSKPKRVEAWAVVRGAEAEMLGVFGEKSKAVMDAASRYMRLSNNIRAVHLLEVNPKAEKVLRLVKKWRKAFSQIERDPAAELMVRAELLLAVDEMEGR